MKYLITLLLLLFFCGCYPVDNFDVVEIVDEPGCNSGDVNVLELRATEVILPEMKDFEVVSYSKSNSNLMIAHPVDNIGLDIQVTEEIEESFVRDKKIHISDEHKIEEIPFGYKVDFEIDEPDPIGNTTFVFVKRFSNDGITVAFTQYDYTGGKHDEYIEWLVDSILIKRR
jgi:hypothetical protein